MIYCSSKIWGSFSTSKHLYTCLQPCKCIYKLATLVWSWWSRQPFRHIKLKINSASEAACNLFLRASASGHLPKRHVQVAMYSFPLSVFGRGPTISISTVCQTWWITECLMEFGPGTLVFVVGLGHLQYSNISNLLLHLVLPTVLNWLGQCGKLGGLAVSAQILSPTYWAQRNIFVIKSFFFSC